MHSKHTRNCCNRSHTITTVSSVFRVHFECIVKAYIEQPRANLDCSLYLLDYYILHCTYIIFTLNSFLKIKYSLTTICIYTFYFLLSKIWENTISLVIQICKKFWRRLLTKTNVTMSATSMQLCRVLFNSCTDRKVFLWHFLL